MKKVVFTILGILLVLAMVSAGCSPKTPTTVQVATQNTSVNTSGTLIGINPPSLPGQDVIVVHTPQGNLMALPIGPHTRYFLEGKECSLEEVLAIQAATGVSYNCSVLYDDETGEQNIYIAKQ